MIRHFLILTILATTSYQKKVPENPYVVDLVDELLKDDGKWILAAAGSDGQQPPHRSCIELTVTDTGIQSPCILVAHNHTAHKVKVLKFIGLNENNETDIVSKAPVHQYMIKSKNYSKIHADFKNEVDWDTAVSSPMCWNLETHKIRNFRFIITPIDKTTKHIYFVSVNTRSPTPEYQVAILTKTKMRKIKLEKLIEIVNYRNFEHLDNRDSPGLFSGYSLPRVQMKCAVDFDMHDPYDTINHKILETKYEINSPPFPEKEFETILVKHK